MRQSRRVTVAALLVALPMMLPGLVASAGATDEDRGGPVATITLPTSPLSADEGTLQAEAGVADQGQLHVKTVEVSPERLAPGGTMKVSGEFSRPVDGSEIAVLIGDQLADTKVPVDGNGRFSGEVVVPPSTPSGPASVSLVTEDGIEFAVDFVTIATSTGIDITGQIADPADTEPATGEDVPGTAPPAVPEETLDDVATAPAAPLDEDMGLLGTATPYFAWAGGVLVAVGVFVGIILLTRRRSRNQVAGMSWFTGHTGEPVDTTHVGHEDTLITWTGRKVPGLAPDVAPGPEAGVPIMSTHPSASLPTAPDGNFAAVEMTERLSSDLPEEFVIADGISMSAAKSAVRDARGNHEPDAEDIETWWVVRRVSDTVTVWIAHSWSKREYDVDPETGELSDGTGEVASGVV